MWRPEFFNPMKIIRWSVELITKQGSHINESVRKIPKWNSVHFNCSLLSRNKKQHSGLELKFSEIFMKTDCCSSQWFNRKGSINKAIQSFHQSPVRYLSLSSVYLSPNENKKTGGKIDFSECKLITRTVMDKNNKPVTIYLLECVIDGKVEQIPISPLKLIGAAAACLCLFIFAAYLTIFFLSYAVVVVVITAIIGFIIFVTKVGKQWWHSKRR
ncbi:uncharacterized protein LOC142318269 [Lycorma delicatula]|uniref:uncharacterized protein LOC142318269 n=1 Tax=Lycorma delicatula TaxID=130591 RepID=UPI003F513D78